MLRPLFTVRARKEPRIGGVIFAKAETRAEIEGIILNDPFNREKIAEYEIIEFLPTMAATHLAIRSNLHRWCNRSPRVRTSSFGAQPPHLPYPPYQRVSSSCADWPCGPSLLCSFCSSARTFALGLPSHKASRTCTCRRLAVILASYETRPILPQGTCTPSDHAHVGRTHIIRHRRLCRWSTSALIIMSHKEPMLYRAPVDVGLPNEWEEDHFIRLGTLGSFVPELAKEITDLSLETMSDGHIAAGQGIYNGNPILVTVHLDPGSEEVIWFGLANCVDPLLLHQLKNRFGVKAFDYENCEYI
jgi:hypothetical protein